MEIARKLAGFCLGGADLLRRAMGKKIQAEMDAQKPLFLDGRRRQRRRQGQGRGGLEPARQVRQLRLQQVARRRLRRGQLPDRLAEGEPPGRVHGRGDELRHPPDRQARRLQAGGRPARHRDGPPCVNRSAATFTVEDGRIVYALGALKNVGVEAMRLIAEARAAGGRFAGLFDFAARVDLRRVGKRALEMLARAGALDALDSNRRKVFDAPRGADRLFRARRTRSAPRRRSASSARRPTRCPRRGCRSPRTGRRWSGWRRSTRRSASTSPATRSTTTPARSAASGC